MERNVYMFIARKTWIDPICGPQKVLNEFPSLTAEMAIAQRDLYKQNGYIVSDVFVERRYVMPGEFGPEPEDLA